MRGFQPAKGKAKPFANGGPVRGPGTGTSDDVQTEVPEGTYIMPADSTQAVGQEQLAAMGTDAKGVPVNLSNGEFKLPPEQVHAIGVQALDQMKDATHTPVAARGFAPAGQQEAEPPMFFANGGVVEEEKHQPTSPTNIYPQSSPSAGANVYGAAGFSADQLGSSGRIAKVPDTIGQQPGRQVAAPAAAPATSQGMSDAQRATAIGQIPTGGLTAPAASAPAAPVAAPAQSPAASGFMPGTRAVFNESGKAISDLAAQGRYGAAAGETARAALSYVPAVVDDVVGGAIRAVGPTVMDAGKQFLGIGDAAAAPAPAASPAPARPGATPAAPAAAGLPAGAGRGSVNPPLANPAAPAPTSTTPAAATEVSPGVFRSGNSFGDSAQAVADIQGRPAGLPSRQNMAAADALAARSQQDSLARGFQPGQGAAAAPLSAPAVSHSGNDWAARQRLKDLETAASSITNRPEWRSGSSTPAWGNRQSAGIVDPDGKIGRFNAALQADLAAQGKAPELQQRTNEVNAGLQRAAMAEAGANERNAADNATRMADVTARGLTDRGRLALEQSRAAMDNQVRGFEVRGAQRQEQLQQRYAAAKTDQERQAISKEIRDLSGKPLESPWKLQVTPAVKNADGSTSEGSIVRWNGQTGEVQLVGPQSAKPSDNHIAALRANPSQADFFDQVYGKGAAARALGKA